MINMMRADLYRIFRSVHIYFAIGIIILMAGISVGMREVGHIGNASIEYQEESLTQEEASFTGMPHTVRTDEQKKEFVLEVLSSNINLYYPLILIVFAILMADFSNHTVKNTLSTAVSKKKYYLSKLVLILLLSTAIILFNSIFIYVLNFIVNGKAYTTSIVSVLRATFRQLPMLWGIAGFMTMIGFLTQRAAAFNAVIIPFQLLFQTLVNALSLLTGWEFLWKFLENYELQMALRKLAFPADGGYIAICCGIGLAEVVVSTLIGYHIFKKSEIR